MSWARAERRARQGFAAAACPVRGVRWARSV